VQWRTLAATMVPIGILLGPMVMTFTWFKDRVDTASWNADAGADVQVVATVDGELNDKDKVTLSVDSPLILDGTTPAAQETPPIRQTLNHLRLVLAQPGEEKHEPWELAAIPDMAGEQKLADLDAFLAKPIPPQAIAWQLRSPKDLVGRFPVSVAVAGQKPVTAYIVLGDQYAPSPEIVDGPKTSAVKQLKVSYPPPKVERIFWRPLGFLKHVSFLPAWLAVYILAYLPTLFVLRAMLRLP
jgi:hypothetical protein